MPKPNPEVLFIFSMPLYSVLCSASCKFSCKFFFEFKRKLSLSKKVFIDMTKMIKFTNDPSLCVCAMLVNYREVATTAACCQGQYHISFFVFKLLLLISSYHKVAFFNT